MIQRLVAIILLIILLPVFGLLYIMVKVTSKGPFIFSQLRTGREKSSFKIYKIRTMKHNADELKIKYLSNNESDGPVFKIHNDPRHTLIGRFLSHTGLDELPQLINIIKGEMTFIGPRPLPLDEAKEVPERYKKRFSVLPGITSLWVVKGAHKLSFQEWMELDIHYINNKNFYYDSFIVFKTTELILQSILQKIRKSDY